jgi:hypothetical protein
MEINEAQNRPAHRMKNLGLLLLFIVLLQFGYPITFEGPWWTAAYMALYAGMVFFGILTVREGEQRLTFVLPLGLVFLGFAAWYSLDQQNRATTLMMLISVATFMFALMASLMRFVFHRREAPGPEVILAAICTYLVMGGFFGAVFSAVEIIQPGSFEDPATPGASPAWQQLVYYSYVTIATLGYGEILPITPWARSLASFETVAGTLFLTVVIARLVGIWASSRRAASE